MNADTPRTDAIVSGLQNMLTRVENSNSLPEKFSQAQATLVQHARQLERTLATQRTKLLALADSIQEQGVANKIREILG